MASELDATTYVRLPGRARRLSGRIISGEAQRLYASTDHLMVLRRVGYEETSKRYALGDIQAITVQSNSDRTIVSAVLAAVMLLFAALGLVAVAQGVGAFDFVMVLIYTVVGLLGGVLVWNLALGPTCTVRLHTAVQIEDLTALRRLRAARRCLAILVPRIEASQGGWPGGAAAMQALAGLPVRVSANAKLVHAKQAPKVIGRTLHVSAFATTAVFGASYTAELFYESATKDVFDSALMIVSTVLLITAAIRQSNSTLPRQTCALTWATLIENSLMIIVMMYITIFVMTFRSATDGDSPNVVTMGTVTFGVEDPRWADMISAGWGILGVLLCLFGLLSIRGYSLVERRPNVDGGVPSP